MDVQPWITPPRATTWSTGRSGRTRSIDPRVIRAMRTLPRERFVPPALAGLAYIDEDIAAARRARLMEPMVLGAPGRSSPACARASGCWWSAPASGYGAAVLAACGGR